MNLKCSSKAVTPLSDKFSFTLSPLPCQFEHSMPAFFHLGQSKHIQSALLLSSPSTPDQSLVLRSVSADPLHPISR